MDTLHTTNHWNEYAAGEYVPRHIVNRFDNKSGNRFYYFKEDGQYHTAAGITTWLSKVMPESSFLTDWKLKYGKDWTTVLNLTADYGTMMHACVAQMMIHNTHPDQSLIDMAKQHLRDLRRFDKSVSEDLIDKNIISFQRFREEYNLKPLLIEALLTVRAESGDYYCLTADLLAECDYRTKKKVDVEDGVYIRGEKKGQTKYRTETVIEVTKEIICIDWKSNWQNKDKKSFFDSHKYQLIATKKAVEQNFGITPTRLCNWAPSAWRSDIGDYTLHEWEITPTDMEIFNLYETMAAKQGHFRPKGEIEIFEKFEPGKTSESMYRKHPYIEYVELMESDKNKPLE